MPYTIEYGVKPIAEALKAARERKGLSQRALGAKSGVPQSHISKIEKGTVDIRVSSLVALARVLELEISLVPRQAVPAVNAIIQNRDKQLDFFSSPAYSLLDDDNG